METTRWQHLQSLFDRAVATGPADDSGQHDTVAVDTAMREELGALIAADRDRDRVGESAARVASDLFADWIAPSTRVGPWRLDEEIGAGGMATVFKAHRDDGAYQRTVAIKFLNGIPSRSGSDRMQRERQILADLDHPGIARLLDGGHTAQGQPYLVMDHIDGVPITRYALACSLEQRLRLIQQVARALHYAHQRLVIHRDLKPDNVLVRANGSPVLLDFGIARLLDAEQTGDATVAAWLTPAYASPEQRRGEAVATASDVYSLGVLMAEVVSGRHLAPRPSGRVLTPSQRGMTGVARARLRELDAMVARACAVDATARYPSAEALAEDIERFLRDQPLSAASPTPLYIAGKFLRRRRYAVAASVLFAATLVAFGWRLADERDRALRAEVQASEQSVATRQVVDYLVSLFDLQHADRLRIDPVTPENLLDSGRQRIVQQFADEPLRQSLLLGVMGKIDWQLGRHELAVDALQEAAAIERQLGSPVREAGHLMMLGVVELDRGQADHAVRHFNDAILRMRDEPDTDLDLARAVRGIAQAHLRKGNHALALRFSQRALRIAENLGDDGRRSAELARELQAQIQTQLASTAAPAERDQTATADIFVPPTRRSIGRPLPLAQAIGLR